MMDVCWMVHTSAKEPLLWHIFFNGDGSGNGELRLQQFSYLQKIEDGNSIHTHHPTIPPHMSFKWVWSRPEVIYQYIIFVKHMPDRFPTFQPWFNGNLVCCNRTLWSPGNLTLRPPAPRWNLRQRTRHKVMVAFLQSTLYLENKTQDWNGISPNFFESQKSPTPSTQKKGA